MFSKGTQQFDFVKRNIIQKLAYKVKINDVFRKFEHKIFLKLAGSIVSNIE